MSERRPIEEALRAYEAPEEQQACDRALALVRAAHAQREPGVRAGGRRRLAAAVGLALAALGTIFVLSPAGASVRDWVSEAVTVERESPPVLRLPAPGSILTVDDGGAWIVHGDGSRRSLGDYRQASLSPRGISVVLSRGPELAAVSTGGELAWSLTRGRPIRDPAWAPSGVRIAYRAGRRLHLVEGDGSPDGVLEADVAPIAPAWRPASVDEPGRDVLAYVDGDGAVRIRDAVEAGEGASITPGEAPQALQWLDDGTLVVVGKRTIEWYGPDRARQARIRFPRPADAVAVDAEPGTRRIAVAREWEAVDGLRSEVALVRPRGGKHRVGGSARSRVVFRGAGPIAGLAFSPQGGWLALGWPQGDSWLFQRPSRLTDGEPETESAVGVSSLFGVGTEDLGGPSAGFPGILEWSLLEG